MKKLAKRLTAALLLLTMVLSLAACSMGGPKDDKAFFKNLQAGLEARWKLSEKNAMKGPVGIAEEREQLRGLVEAETKKLGLLSDYQFQDEELKALAEKYMDALNNQNMGAKYMENDEEKFNELFVGGRIARSEVVCELVSKYQFTVNDKYIDVLDEMVIEGENHKALQKALKDLEEDLSNVVLDHAGTNRYTFSFENTSDLDLENLHLDIRGVDAEGNNLPECETYLKDIDSGDSLKDELYVESEFAKASLRLTFFYKTDEYSTEFVDVSVNDDLIINMIMPDLPIELNSFGLWDKKEQTFQITSIEMNPGSWYEGKCSVKMLVSGTKLFDEKGDSKSSACRATWKVYDENGAVLDSGTIYTSECTVGEQFKNCEVYVSNLVPGTYRLELMDYKWD